jgi:hypothetical protein
MKRYLFLLSVFSVFGLAQVAHAQDVTCFFNSDSDYELHLYIENGVLNQVSFANADWSQFGAPIAVTRTDSDAARGMIRYQVAGTGQIVEIQPQLLNLQDGAAYTPSDDRDYHCGI